MRRYGIEVAFGESLPLPTLWKGLCGEMSRECGHASGLRVPPAVGETTGGTMGKNHLGTSWGSCLSFWAYFWASWVGLGGEWLVVSPFLEGHPLALKGSTL